MRRLSAAVLANECKSHHCRRNQPSKGHCRPLAVAQRGHPRGRKQVPLRAPSAIVRSHGGPKSVRGRGWTIHSAGPSAGRASRGWALFRRLQTQQVADRDHRHFAHRRSGRDLPAPAEDLPRDLDDRARRVVRFVVVVGCPVDSARPQHGGDPADEARGAPGGPEERAGGGDGRFATRQGARDGRPGCERDQHRRDRRHRPGSGRNRQQCRRHVPGQAGTGWSVSDSPTSARCCNKQLAALQASLTPLNQSEIGSQIASVRQQLTDLALNARSGSSLELAERAQAPDSPSSPRPIRNAALRVLRQPLHRRPRRPRARSTQAAGQRLTGAEPPARPPGDGGGAVRPSPVRSLAEHAERDRVRGLPDAPGVAQDAAAARRTANRARDERLARRRQDGGDGGARSRAGPGWPEDMARLGGHALAAAPRAVRRGPDSRARRGARARSPG